MKTKQSLAELKLSEPEIACRIKWREKGPLDFPLSSIDIWAGFDGQHWTLYLPSEH